MDILFYVVAGFFLVPLALGLSFIVLFLFFIAVGRVIDLIS